MSIFDDLPTSDVEIVSSQGELVAKTKATVVPQNIIITDTKIPISTGDEVRRRLPSGQDEVFEVTDPTFQERFHDMPAHYQLKYRRKGTFKHGEGGNYTVHVSGNNARVNISSQDHSSNVVVQGDVFGDVTSALKAGVQDQEQLAHLLQGVNELRSAQGKSGYLTAYQKLITLCKDHMTLIAPFLPALTNLIPSR
ncbi:hypothetical protein [Bradyrhizobium elkanii]